MRAKFLAIPQRSEIASYIWIITANVLILGLLLVFVEGFASWVLAVRHLLKGSPITERRHTRYDPDLGWSHEPNLYIRDMYGRGAHLRTNSQGFRSDHDFAVTVPRGKYRIICSGDSFTLGYGVGDNDTWCQLLAALDPRLETVNMGQGGYGLDQIYLWYKRDGLKLQQHVQLLAVIGDDFNRMQQDTFLGYGKPILRIEENRLVPGNIPIPKRSYASPWLTTNLRNFSDLRVLELARRVSSKGPDRERPSIASDKDKIEKTQKVVRLILKDLKHLHDERSSVFALIYIPVQTEVKRPLDELDGNESQNWIRFIEAESQGLKIPFINLLHAFKTLPYNEVDTKYRGHLSVEGNAFVARAIFHHLKSDPAFLPVLPLNK